MEGIASQVSLDTQNNVISERRLWTAVLVNAVEDWRGGRYAPTRSARGFSLNLTRTLRWFAPEQV